MESESEKLPLTVMTVGMRSSQLPGVAEGLLWGFSAWINGGTPLISQDAEEQMLSSHKHAARDQGLCS